MAKSYEFRCPVHGFITIDEWERDVINHPAFQRLRRIRQLGWTDYIYPGAVHTRFEHSLGVMHLATRLYDAVRCHSEELLKSEFNYEDVGLDRHRRIVRFAALLHDLGHGPFSHAVEHLLPLAPDGSRYSHEDYSAAMIRELLHDTIENHPKNDNYDIHADDIAGLLEGSSNARGLLFWREIITGQMDADRMDYLLRDSHHLGVRYGKYDIDRLINTVCAVPPSKSKSPRLGVSEGGWHAAESLILARYYMFTQVYFHRTRVAYDHHIVKALEFCVPKGLFPKPDAKGIKEYIRWDDWRVLGLLANEKAGEHGKRLAERNHYRMVYETGETPSPEELTRLAEVKAKLGAIVCYEAVASKSWYKLDETDIPVLMEQGEPSALSTLSSPVANMTANNKTLLYARPEDRDAARAKLEGPNE